MCLTNRLQGTNADASIVNDIVEFYLAARVQASINLTGTVHEQSHSLLIT